VFVPYGDIVANKQFFLYGFVDDLPVTPRFLRDVEMVFPVIPKDKVRSFQL